MLERACNQNNSIMVECLLLLGANANQAKEATSLICQVNIEGLTFIFSPISWPCHYTAIPYILFFFFFFLVKNRFIEV